MKLKDVVVMMIDAHPWSEVARMGLTNILDGGLVTPNEATAILIEGEEMQLCHEEVEFLDFFGAMSFGMIVPLEMDIPDDLT
jgi:hypothetical protein